MAGEDETCRGCEAHTRVESNDSRSMVMLMMLFVSVAELARSSRDVLLAFR